MNEDLRRVYLALREARVYLGARDLDAGLMGVKLIIEESMERLEKIEPLIPNVPADLETRVRTLEAVADIHTASLARVVDILEGRRS